ncbi:hypothetical protein AAU57_14035 [Nonlabens sp. YIK11]|uniref:relaxase/mobilization nuclease domain-containing protein n=1 Tax=Nonlabens sp. YIK11 TaxID=1453349 RepID=UPI0006DCAEED|nr:relaxase/mobilization nuclease domain-containing protein [Nonlabens sp. YIK11]KQC34333.1 hypothetical protein AAU57_14035 [Nonlabens sp. YIK11]
MIAKVSTTSSAKVAIDYANDQKKEAKIVSKHMLLGTEVNKFHQDFEMIQKLNTNCKKNVISVILSLSVDNKAKVTNKVWKQVVADFSTAMKLDQHQHVAFLHKDKSHRHVHLYYNRIDFDGKAYKDFKIGKKAGDVAHEISLQRGWISAKEISKNNKQESIPIRKETYQNHQAITESPYCSTLEKYIDSFRLKDVDVKIVMGKNGKVNGLRFNTQKYSFRASEVHREMGFNKTIRKIYPQLSLKQVNEELLTIFKNSTDERSQIQLIKEIDRALQQIQPGWISAKQVSKNKKQESISIRKVIHQNHRAIIENPNSSTLEKYIDYFRHKEVDVKIVMGKNGKVNGLRFNTKKYSFKASEVHREMSFNKTIRKIYPQLSSKQFNEELSAILESSTSEGSQQQLIKEIDRALEQILGQTVINEQEDEDMRIKNRQEQSSTLDKSLPVMDTQNAFINREKSYINNFLEVNDIRSLPQLALLLRSQNVKINPYGFSGQMANTSMVQPYLRMTSEKVNEKVDLFKLLELIYPMATIDRINKVVEASRINRLASLNALFNSIDLGLKEETVKHISAPTKIYDSANHNNYLKESEVSDGYKSKLDAAPSRNNLENISANQHQSTGKNEQQKKLSPKEYINKLHYQIISNPDITGLKEYVDEFAKHGVIVGFDKGKFFNDVNASFSFKGYTVTVENIQHNEEFYSLMMNGVDNNSKNLSADVSVDEPNPEFTNASENTPTFSIEETPNDEMGRSFHNYSTSKFVASDDIEDPGDPDHCHNPKKKKKKRRGYKR